MSTRILRYPPLHTDLAALLLRLVFGGLMLYHGYDKVMNYTQYAAMYQETIGMGARLEFNLVVFAEFICAILVIIGLWTRLAVIPIFIAMSVAFFVAHGKDPFQVKELAFAFMTLSVVVFVLGSGAYSVDGAWQRNRVRRV
jgi:putative oxidoreductase